MDSNLKRRFFATYYDTPARVVYGGEDLHIEADGWWPGLLEGDLTSYYLLLKGSDDDLTYDETLEFDRGYDLGAIEKIEYELDYLRSLGFANPFMGYSVERLIDLGWIKIKQ